MVRKSEWSDEQLEELLRSLPKVEDHRDPKDIYQNIQLKLHQKKKRSYVIPSLATAAAILLFVILAPNFMTWNQANDSTMQESAPAESNMEMKVAIDEDKSRNLEKPEASMEMTETEEESDINIATFDGEVDDYTALYASDVTNEHVYTFAIPEREVNFSVPVTVLVTAEEGKTALELYRETMSKLDEEGWGLFNYYPLKAELSIDDKLGILNVVIPVDHAFSQGSSAEKLFTESIMQAAYTLGLEKVALYTDNQPGIDFGHHGYLTELDPSELTKRGYFIYYPHDGAEKPYLAPYQGEYESIGDALNGMKEYIPSNGLIPSIPSEIQFDEILPSDEEGVLTLKVNENTELLNEPTTIQMIEAILLTAKDFGFEKVVIQYNKQKSIGKFLFNEEIEVPLAANKKMLSN